MEIIKLWSAKRSRQNRFERILEPHIKHLYNLAYRFTGNRTDAEDLVQDVLIKLYPRMSEMAGILNLRTWLAKVLYRTFVDKLRQQSRSPIDLAIEEVSEIEHHDINIAVAPNGENDYFIAQVEDALYQLNSDQRSLVVLHDVEGYTLAELEGILDTPIGTLKSRLNRARRKLRDQLMEPFPEIERDKQVIGS